MRRGVRYLTLIIAALMITATAPLDYAGEAIAEAPTAVEASEEPRKPEEKRVVSAVFLKAELTPPPEAVLSIKETSPTPEPEYTEAVSVRKGTRTSLGMFTLTAYCGCPECCGKWSGLEMSIPTQAGHPYPVEGYTISVDPGVIPLKSVVEIDGWGLRYAHDTGSMIKGNRIDLYFDSHEDALSFGRRELEIWQWE